MTARALLLDALGTLVELPDPAPALREELSARHAVELSREQAARALGAEIAYYRAHFDEGRDPDGVAALRRRCAEVLRDALPSPARRLGVDDVLGALLAALRFRAYPDAAPALSAARERGVRVVVASNWDVSLSETLERIGLLALLDGVVTSAAVGERKPARALFARALAVAGVDEPGAAVHVGDTVREDVEGALAAGLRAVLIRRDGGRPAPGAAVPVIASLAELRSLL